MDVLRLKGLRFFGFHGVYKNEQKKGNTFEIDATFYLPLQTAAVTDNLEQTLNYQLIYNAVKSVIEGPSKLLIEHLAYLIGTSILPHVNSDTKFEITVRKINPPLPSMVEFSEVTLSWPR